MPAHTAETRVRPTGRRLAVGLVELRAAVAMISDPVA
jgi:hypothetical protein